MAAQKFSGIWNFKSSAKTFGDYLRASGLSEPLVKFGESTKPVITIKIDGNTFFYKSQYTPEQGFEYECKYGEEFDQTTADGRQVKTTITWDDNEIVQTQRYDAFEAVIKRYLNCDGDLVTDLRIGDVVGTRIFARSSPAVKS